jgi:hypothetical protein
VIFDIRHPALAMPLVLACSLARMRCALALQGCDATPTSGLRGVHVHGNDKTAEPTVLELLPRRPPSRYSLDELLEFERRLNNLGIFDHVAVTCDADTLNVEVREKWTLVPDVDFATGETFEDTYVLLGATEYNLLGTGKQLGVSAYHERRGFGLSAAFREHDYKGRGWAFSTTLSVATVAVTFNDDTGWRTASVIGEAYFRSPPLLGHYANYSAGLYVSQESVYSSRRADAPHSTQVVQSRMGLSWDNYEWHDLVPSGLQATVWLDVGGMFGVAPPKPRHSAELALRAAIRLGPLTAIVTRVEAVAGTRGDVNYGFLLGSLKGVRGVPDARYLDWIHAFANVELRHSFPLLERWALQLVGFGDAAVFEPMTASGGRDILQHAYSVGAGLRVIPSWISALTPRVDVARLLAAEPAWFLQVGLTQYF